MPANTQRLDAVMPKYVAGQLARFWADLEGHTHGPVGAVHTDAARLLSDLCRFCGLNKQQHNRVLGETGARHVHTVDRSFKCHPPPAGPRFLG